MRKTLSMITFFFASAGFTAENPVDRWANAIGGREKVAAIKSIYREAAIEVGGYAGSIKVWHTADGKYRKEEQIATFSSIETFDGTNGTVQQGAAPPHKMAGAELVQSISKRFANSNAIFFVFFPERRRGSVAIEGDDTIVFKPEGGIEWRVMLDPRTSLPNTMVHKEGDRTITVTFVSYETVEGIKFEKEIHRSTGDARFDAVIRFTKTVINPPVDASLFAISSNMGAPAVWVMAPSVRYIPAEHGGGQAKAIEMYEKGLEVIRKHKTTASPWEPSGEPALLMNLAFSNVPKATADVAAAERYAQEALILAPYWHYPRDICLRRSAQSKLATLSCCG